MLELMRWLTVESGNLSVVNNNVKVSYCSYWGNIGETLGGDGIWDWGGGGGPMVRRRGRFSGASSPAECGAWWVSVSDEDTTISDGEEDAVVDEGECEVDGCVWNCRSCGRSIIIIDPLM